MTNFTYIFEHEKCWSLGLYYHNNIQMNKKFHCLKDESVSVVCED
jgi:hypothetical protein